MDAPWMRLSRLTEAGLSWSLAKGAPHIKICSVDSAANPLTVQALWDTITAVGGSNLALPSKYSIVGATLLRDTHRAMQFSNKLRDLGTKYSGLKGNSKHPFHIALEPPAAWRLSILDHFKNESGAKC